MRPSIGQMTENLRQLPLRRRSLCLPLALFGLLASGGRLHAGGGPENVLLVVNSASAESQTIANNYVQLRNIPPKNVVYFDWRGSDAHIDVNTLREKILQPIIKEIDARGLTSQIDYIVYSSSFPWSVDFNSDLPEDARKDQAYQFPVGSLTGLTYLLRPVMSKDALLYARLTANHYMRLRESIDDATYQIPTANPADKLQAGAIPAEPPQRLQEPVGKDFSVGSHGFRSWYGWGPDGELMETGGARYVLSTMLGVTYGRGNSLKEILNYLRQSASADGIHPQGTIYYMDTGDVHRSGPRRPGFDMAVALLKQLGITAQIVQGDVPHDRSDVQGLLTGVADFNWATSGSVIRPGAICESLTSFGGDLEASQIQTPLSVFLRFGAAGASGTVAEPFAIQNKFPYAMIQVHYARGCTLAEAFYQSVYSPYQLLIVGDPLCRPWANIPEVAVKGVTAGATLKGKATLYPSAALHTQGAVDRFYLFVDGVAVSACAAGDSLEFETAHYSDGYHELRVVGVENSSIESQGRQIIPVHFDNYNKKMRFDATPRTVPPDRALKLKADAPGAIGVAFYLNERMIAKFSGASGEKTIDPSQLGAGPVTLRAIGWGKGTSVANQVIADPVQLVIENAIPPKAENPAAAARREPAPANNQRRTP